MATPNTVITRLDLSSTWHEFDLEANRKGFIAPKVFRPRVVQLQSADVGKVPLEALLRRRRDTRAPGAGYRRSGFEFEKYEYSTEEHGVEEAMDQRTLALYGDILDTEMIHRDRALNAVLENFEADVAAAASDAAVWTGSALATAVSGGAWTDHDNADPIADGWNAKFGVKNGSGLEVNAAIINDYQLYHACQCASVIDRVKYAGFDDPKKIGPAQLAALWQVDRVFVAGYAGAGLQNTAKEGQPAALSRIWGNTRAIFAKVAVTDDPREPCVGRAFLWSGDGPGAPGTGEELAVIVEEYEEPQTRSRIIRVRNDRGIKVMYPEAAHHITGVAA